MKAKKTKLIVSGCAILVIFILGVYFYKRQHAANQILPADTWVNVVTIKTSDLPLETAAIGAITAKSVDITSEMTGHVKSINFKDGNFAKKGDLLIELDDAIYKTKVMSAKAQLAYSENDYKRKALLIKQGAVTKQVLDQADADLKQKRAALEESEVTLNKMRLVAPFDGMLGKSQVNLGEYITANKTIVNITDTKHLRVEYTIPETYLSRVKLGQEVSISSSAYAKKTFTGKVAFISPTVNSANRSISIYADVLNENNLLAAGMFVHVTHKLGTTEKVIMIPARSLVPILDGEQVYKIVDGKAFPTTVVLGKRNQEMVQVTEGLAIGDQVITDGQNKVKNNMPVKIKT